MEQEKVQNTTSALIKSVIHESKKFRAERGEGFFSNKKQKTCSKSVHQKNDLLFVKNWPIALRF